MILYDILKDGTVETVCRTKEIAERVAESYSRSFPLSKIDIFEYEIQKDPDKKYIPKLV